MAKNIDTTLATIQELFKKGKILKNDGKFIIPEYQRAYNWDANSQCDKLWQDIETFIETNKNAAYFFGSIIINNEKEELFLIDGQQRVTTFFLLLKSLLSRIDEILSTFIVDDESRPTKDLLERRREHIIQCLYTIDEDDMYLLNKGTLKYSDLDIKYLNQSINETYKDELPNILHGNSYDDIANRVHQIAGKRKYKYTKFYNNFLYFKEKFSAMDSTAINRFARELLQNCQVIVVVSYDTEEAIEIFNSLNSTGLPLADADIISAKLYANFGSDKSTFNSNWWDIITRADELAKQKIVSIDDILNEYMYIVRARNNEKETTMPSVRRYFLEINKSLINNPTAFVDDMDAIISLWENKSAAERYDEEVDAATAEKIQRLNNIKEVLLKNNSNFKFFYATYHYFNKDSSLDEKISYGEALLKLFALLTITGSSYSSANFKQFLIGLNMEIGNGLSTADIVSKIEQHVAKNFAKDRANILNNLKDPYAASGLVYLNEYLFAKEKGMPLDLVRNDIQIEHVMPASGKNIEAIRDDAKMNKEEFAQYADKLGNKILLEQNINGSISNDWFRVKKQKKVADKRGYHGSVFPIAQCLTSYPSDRWEKTDIDTATQKAADRITKFLFE